MNVTKYPTLFAVTDGRVHKLPGLGSSLAVMNADLDQALATSYRQPEQSVEP